MTLLELRKDRRLGGGAVAPETVYGRIMRPDTRSIGIPIRMSNGAPGTRQCTLDFKIRVVARWMRRAGCTADAPGVVGLGISTDEFQRARSASGMPQYTLDYPLIRLRLSRADCLAIIADAGLPPAPKSSCWFCPYHRPARWQQMRQDRPVLFEQAVALERTINERRAALGRNNIYLHRALKPLDRATTDAVQLGLPLADDNCESGFCGL